MGNFKVGDTVKRVSTCGILAGLPAGKVGIVRVLRGTGFVGVEGYGGWLHNPASLELVTWDDELPPAPESVLYNACSDHGCSLEVSSLKANEYYDARIRIGVRNNCGAKQGKVAYLTPDAALQLAHDLRRMAMEIRRQERNG